MMAAAARHGVLFRSVVSAPNVPLSQEIEALGQAIRKVRERRGLGQKDAATAMDPPITRSAWANYEAGRPAILRSDVQASIANALGVPLDEILAEQDKILGIERRRGGAQVIGLAEHRRPFELSVFGRARAGTKADLVYDVAEPETTVDLGWMFSPAGAALRVSGDSMTASSGADAGGFTVESGDLVFYDRTQWPRKGDGCVVELNSGEVYVKEYVRSQGGSVVVRQRFPDEELSWPLAEVKGVYKIRFKGS